MTKQFTDEEVEAVVAEFDGAFSSLQSKLAARLILQARAERDEALERIAALEAERDENLRLIGVVAKNREHFMAKCEKAEMRVQQLEAEVEYCYENHRVGKSTGRARPAVSKRYSPEKAFTQTMVSPSTGERFTVESTGQPVTIVLPSIELQKHLVHAKQRIAELEAEVVSLRAQLDAKTTK